MNLECVSLGKRQIKNDNNNYRTDIYIYIYIYNGSINKWNQNNQFKFIILLNLSNNKIKQIYGTTKEPTYISSFHSSFLLLHFES